MYVNHLTSAGLTSQQGWIHRNRNLSNLMQNWLRYWSGRRDLDSGQCRVQGTQIRLER